MSSGCLKRSVLGCGGLIVLTVIVAVVGGIVAVRPLYRAVDLRGELEERIGAQDAFTPDPSGAIAPERIAVFLTVRRALASSCGDLSKAESQFVAMERFDGKDEAPSGEVLRQAAKTVGSALSLAPLLGRFFETRNQALIDSGMGLGEYTFLFVVAYHHQIVTDTGERAIFNEDIINARVREGVLSMLERQREALLDSDPTSAEVDPLDTEIAALTSDSERIPWQDGLPAATVVSLAPYQREIDALFCPAAAPIELAINRRIGPTVESM
jgi:hypothetical protein